MGLECSGYLVDNINKDNLTISNRRVMALLSGGGYAEYAKVHKKHIIPIPDNIDFTQVKSLFIK